MTQWACRGPAARSAEAFKMFSHHGTKGLGQLEAFIDADEGVAFQMDNLLFWDSLGTDYNWAIYGLFEKKQSSKFQVTLLPSGNVLLRDWKDMYLAPRPVGRGLNTSRIIAVEYSEDASLQYEVFYRENKVAFRACNGLYLSRVFRSFHTVEAAKHSADDSCYFQPMIGDLIIPTFEILRVTTSNLSQVKCYPCVLMKETYINRSEEPESHTFTMTWEIQVADNLVWHHLWGLGVASFHQFNIMDMTATLAYSQDNERVVTVMRYICETHTEQVTVPPNRKATALLLTKKHDVAVVDFVAIIGKVKSNGDVVTLHEHGTWSGLVYRDVHLEVQMERLCESCTAI
ncbi:uncharacterized protein LOC128344469 isoform X2 [Hemicordylus capensis]|uniref:uncharacterized protein LOC128344469 isoform X2 n=1 Tax=Hemicordylus capensis TaxID=884348 RepID=UPI00230241A6|nr:uncharacterized protein LOC128344469 isoform X2 [Hemicordylus capensis]